MKPVAVLDTETTGLNDPQPIEVGYIRLHLLETYSGNLLVNGHEQFQQAYLPSKPIEPGASKVHGKTLENLIGCPPHTDFKLPHGITYIIGHQIDYDARVLGVSSPQYKFICTVKLARLLWPEMKTHKLAAIITEFFPDIAARLLQNAHGALVDAKLCLLILQEALNQFEGLFTWEDFHDLAGVFPKAQEELLTMPFGKHKGQKFEEIPQSYLRWVIEDSTANQAVKKAARAHYHGQ
jgi:exodeoxyribonuclease X